MINSDPEFPLAYKALQTIGCLSVLNGNITQTESGTKLRAFACRFVSKNRGQDENQGRFAFPCPGFSCLYDNIQP